MIVTGTALTVLLVLGAIAYVNNAVQAVRRHRDPNGKYGSAAPRAGAQDGDA